MQAADTRPITLAIGIEGSILSVSLTDSRSVGRFSHIEVAPATLSAIRARAGELQRRALHHVVPVDALDGAEQAAQELGRAIFGQLLPEPVREFLTRSRPRPLNLQISQALDDLPWEIAFDGSWRLGDKFAVARQLIADDESEAAEPVFQSGGDSLKLLLVRGADTSAGDAPAEALAKRLGALNGVTLTVVQAQECEPARLLALLAQSHVACCIGPASGLAREDGRHPWCGGSAAVTIEDIAGQGRVPMLLITAGTGTSPGGGPAALARAAYRAGLNALVCAAGPSGVTGAGFVARVVQELAQGASLADAVRHARGSAQRDGAGLSVSEPGRPYAAGGPQFTTALYGDGAAVPCPEGRHRALGDSLRQVTIMSYDLVDSTRLMGTLGAENYSEVLASYHARCGAIVARHGGVSDDPQGDDGIMSYFGFPVAYEDAARQAVLAGLEIIDAVAQLGVHVRIGVATGQVVVKAGQPVGVNVHFAARLQSIAEPGSMVISDTTHQLVKGTFRCQALEQLPQLKGFDRPGTAYRVLGEARAGAPGRAEGAPRLTPFVNRERERQALEEHWQRVTEGGVRAVLISGEAGIGKSRLVREFRRSLKARGFAPIQWRCTPGHTHSAFHALTDFLYRFVRLGDEPLDDKLDKIHRTLAQDIGVDNAVPLIAALLSIPFERRYPRLEYTAERQRQLTLDVLVAWFRREARHAPVCLIVEDIHWIDPSSRELLNRMLTDAGSSRLMALVTQRSEAAEPRWAPGVAVHHIDLKGLTPEVSRSMVMGACGEAPLPADLVRLLAARGDGVPLFIEESTRMAVDLYDASEASDLPPAWSFAVPATIHDLLMARLDRLGPAKRVAQVGGTLGREFPLALMQAVLAHESSPLHIEDVAGQLASLVSSGLLLERPDETGSVFFFKHALVRDTAYQSLWERDRKRLHRTVAIVIAERFTELVESQPELLAYHYTQAGNDADAIAYWERAARRAASRSAHDEAISHLASGLALVARLPESQDRDRAELRLQLLLASRYIAVEGYGAEKVERAYARAAQLCQTLGDEAALMKAQLGLEGYHFMRGNFAQAHAFAQQAAARAERSSDPMHRLQSTWAIANILFHQGELAAAVRHMDDCLEEYGKTQHRPSAVQDPGVMCLCYSAWGLWEMGFPDEALRRATRVVELSERLQHKFSIGEAYGFRTTVHLFRGEYEEALRWARRAIQYCEECGFAVWLAHARVMHGRAVAELGKPAEGIEEMRQGYEMWAVTGAIVTRPFYLAMQAEGFALAGRPEGGLTLLDLALDIVRQCGERYYEAEIMRLYGEMVLQSAVQQGRNRDPEAERWFLSALESARTRQLDSLALRSATSLGRLWLSQGRSDDAVGVLQPAIVRVKEGQGTRDVEKARVLLEVLRPTASAAFTKLRSV